MMADTLTLKLKFWFPARSLVTNGRPQRAIHFKATDVGNVRLRDLKPIYVRSFTIYGSQTATGADRVG
jgi:hypothetical protein